MGQHLRHSMDHMERATVAAATTDKQNTPAMIHYDTRTRGGADEQDMDAAQARIERVQAMLAQVVAEQESSSSSDNLENKEVQACFMLSGDNTEEFKLPSTAARELGFAAHHAIHHLAMVKIIALHTAKLPAEDLPADFGRAPSTVNYDRNATTTTRDDAGLPHQKAQ